MAVGSTTGCIRFRSDAPVADAAAPTADASGETEPQDADVDGPLAPICAPFDPSIADTIAESTFSLLTADCRVRAYFAPLPALRVDHFVQCLAAQLGSVLGCARADGTKVKYPAFDTAGKICADMKSAHAALSTSDGDFEAFMGDLIGATSTAGLTSDEITRVARAYGSTRSDIVRMKNPGPTRACDAAAGEEAPPSP